MNDSPQPKADAREHRNDRIVVSLLTESGQRSERVVAAEVVGLGNQLDEVGGDYAGEGGLSGPPLDDWDATATSAQYGRRSDQLLIGDAA